MLSIFAWKRSSPRKRPPQTPRYAAPTVANNLASEFSETTQSTTERGDVICEDSTEDSTVEIETPEEERDYDFAEKSKKEPLISELHEKLSAAIVKNEELEEMVLKLKRQIVDLKQKYEKLEEQLLSFKTSRQMTHS